MNDVKRFFVRWLSGPFFLVGAIWLIREWMGGMVVTLVGIPLTPLLILGVLGAGLFCLKLGYVDGDVEAIMKFLER